MTLCSRVMDRLLAFNAVVIAVGLGAAGCASLRDDMIRAEEAYTATRYDHARVWLDDLEMQTPDMEPEMRARFYYLRGMTAYRLNERNDALHYLALAREVATDDESLMRPEWRSTLERTLTELTPEDASFRARGGAAPTRRR